jgi:hypothetical protein
VLAGARRAPCCAKERGCGATAATDVSRQFLTFIIASHRENDDEKNIALRQNQDDALTRLAPRSKNVSQKRTA